MASPHPRIAIVALGGTIASIPIESGGAAPALDAAVLVAAVQGLEAVASIEVVSFRQVPGAHLGVADLVELAELVRMLARAGVDGVVITQGTDTIEETSFALDLQLGNLIPVVVTGAMRGPSENGADGAANLLGSVRVAASTKAVGAGVLVVMDDTVHTARWVRKVHSSRPSAFSSPMTGPIGWITEDVVTIAWAPRERTILEHIQPVSAPRVALLPTWLGDDGRLIATAAKAGYAAMVLQALGAGHVNPAVADAIGAALVDMPVIFASRTGSGETLRRTYGFVGSERDLIARGAIPAGSLEGVKARLLLELLLSRAGRSIDDAIAEFRHISST